MTSDVLDRCWYIDLHGVIFKKPLIAIITALLTLNIATKLMLCTEEELKQKVTVDLNSFKNMTGSSQCYLLCNFAFISPVGTACCCSN
jgi:hypothetical protein